MYIGCASADDIDFNDIAARYQPIVFAFVLGLSFILLLIVFRSIVMLFAILFGLSMDYQVFLLLSRIQERYNQTKNNSESVMHGVTTTASLITGAAVIMVAVFAAGPGGRHNRPHRACAIDYAVARGP